ncbi:MAG: MBOAT family protein [Verrucomicrobiales bacterium]
MVFSSHIFIFYFLALVLGAYYIAPRSWRHLVLTLSSYAFYGWWNPWFVFLMLGSTWIDYRCGKIVAAEGASPARRKTGLWTSILVNLGILAFFKYAGFFSQNVSTFAELLGFGEIILPPFFYEIILPVGISFYTFQSMSYTIDIYRGHARPAPDFLGFACYVSMFPQLVAGPIVRYGSIADQIRSRSHSVGVFTYGLTRFNFGFAKKILLANPAGEIADLCFGAGDGSLSTPAAWIGVSAYAFQIYFDFSAYSDMAIGLGRMFGFRFPENFNSPYKAKSITEFWRRWHISLSSFLRDYLYIPLGGNRKGTARTYINLMLVMLIGGLWHGAQWTFIAWGAIHGGMLALERFTTRHCRGTFIPVPVKITATFIVVLVTWVFFRAENFEVAGRYLGAMFAIRDSAPSADLLLAQVTRPAALLFMAACFWSAFAMPRTAEILKTLTAAKVIIGLAVLLLALGLMFTQEFNPFLYFQF